MSATHTPGPWRMVRFNTHRRAIFAAPYTAVADVRAQPLAGRREANGYLIAAAPAALAWCEANGYGRGEVPDQLRAALAQVTGEERGIA
jgi:hypothetical protein